MMGLLLLDDGLTLLIHRKAGTYNALMRSSIPLNEERRFYVYSIPKCFSAHWIGNLVSVKVKGVNYV